MAMNNARIVPALVLLGSATLAAASPPVATAPGHEAAAPARQAAGAAPHAATARPTTAAKAAAPPPAAAAADPMDQLRQRLAERLVSGKAMPAAVAGDVQLVAQPGPGAPRSGTSASTRSTLPVAAHQTASPPHAGTPQALTVPPSAAAAATPPPARRAAAKADPHAAAAHWDYNGPAGPQTWGGLRPEFALCGLGQRQSPIDIRGGLAVDLEPVRFDYKASRFSVIDNGHTVQANLAPGNAIELGGRRFELQQLHFHRPSEESIDGRQFEMSVHLVHRDAQGKLAVVALLLDKGPPQPAVQQVWNNLPLERHDDVQARVPLELVDLLPVDRRYYTYMGSLTTPPCSEGVQWVVMRQPITLSPEQIDLFAKIYPMNARPLQQVAGRRIIQSN